MIGERNIPTQIQLLYQEQELTKHHRKLEEIHKNDRKKKVVVDKDLGTKSKLFESRERNQKFHLTEKANAIEKDNELLLGRLVEISRKKKTTLFPLKSENTLPRTLNGPSRKREKDRIATENEAFARRLLSQQPSFNRKKLEVDYGRHQERVKNMQRLVAFSPRVKLPPLLNKTTEHEPKTQRNTTEVKKDEKKHNISVNTKKKPERITEDEREHTQEDDDKKKKSPSIKKVEEKLHKVDENIEKVEEPPKEVPLENVTEQHMQQGDQQQQQPQSAQQVKAQTNDAIEEDIPEQTQN